MLGFVVKLLVEMENYLLNPFLNLTTSYSNSKLFEERCLFPVPLIPATDN